MVNAANRMPALRDLWNSLLGDPAGRKVADIGCGTGLHSRALADLGFTVVGVDPSEAMLARARALCADQPRVQFEEGGFLAEALTHRGPFEVLICVGNTLPHLEGLEDLEPVFRYWHSLLRPGGRLIVQLLNYNRILAKTERIVAVKRTEHILTVRFYDFLDTHLRFNILTIDETVSPPSHSLISTMLTPIDSESLFRALEGTGFSSIDREGDLRHGAWTEESTDTVVLATRS